MKNPLYLQMDISDSKIKTANCTESVNALIPQHFLERVRPKSNTMETVLYSNF